MHGPTTGDRVRLGDTNLLVEVQKDYAQAGDETLWGFGKTIRSRRNDCGVTAAAATQLAAGQSFERSVISYSCSVIFSPSTWM